ncbi:hypothetical protein Tco_0709429, partial [Tanacetum coccineum]
MFTEQIIPFYENVKQLVQKLDENIVTEVTEYMRIFDELDTEYERCVLANKNLKIERKNLLIQNDCLIANSLEKDICSIVLASDIVVPPSSNCLCEELRSNCDREHSKVVELEAEILKKQQMLNESEKRSFDKQALETELTQLKDALTSVRIQIDGYKAENINALTAENAKLKTELSGKKIVDLQPLRKPKVHAPKGGMYTKQFKEPPKTSNRPTHKPLVQQNKKPNVPVNLSTRTKPATESRKPMQSPYYSNHLSCPYKVVNCEGELEDQLERLLVVLSLSGNPLDDISRCQLGRNVADSIAERLKRPTAYKFRQIAVSLLSRTESNRNRRTIGMEDLKALSWKTCQEEQTATGKEISNPFLADSLLKTIRMESEPGYRELGGTGRRAGSGGGKTRGRSGDQGNGRDDGPGGQVGGQGSE